MKPRANASCTTTPAQAGNHEPHDQPRVGRKTWLEGVQAELTRADDGPLREETPSFR